jgi:hypothetical protein
LWFTLTFYEGQGLFENTNVLNFDFFAFGKKLAEASKAI